MNDRLLNTKELARYLGVAISTITQYRLDGTGPDYVKLGHLVRYKIADVEKWLDARKGRITA